VKDDRSHHDHDRGHRHDGPVTVAVIVVTVIMTGVTVTMTAVTVMMAR